jgi:hypothetical protein
MSGLFRDITIPLGGVDYTVTPSNKLLRKIEGKGRRDDPDFNLVSVFMRLSAGAGAVNEAAFVLAEMINASGGAITEDDALAHMIGFNDSKEYRAFIDLFCSCVMPEVKAKKPDAPKEA